MLSQMKKSNFWVRVAVFWFFMLEGGYNGIFSAYLPGIQTRLNISDKVLGLAIFLLSYSSGEAAKWTRRRKGWPRARSYMP